LKNLGGDDIDRYIAIEYLFPNFLKKAERKKDDFRTPEKNRIVSTVLKAAEQLKIMICENYRFTNK
jgi:molecular chaperone DnaK